MRPVFHHLVISLGTMADKFELDKWVWTEADFEQMAWHDVRIRAIHFGPMSLSLPLISITCSNGSSQKAKAYLSTSGYLLLLWFLRMCEILASLFRLNLRSWRLTT